MGDARRLDPAGRAAPAPVLQAWVDQALAT